MKLEGGFQGRTNKLVDSCYSFWQGGAFPLIYTVLAKGVFLVVVVICDLINVFRRTYTKRSFV